MSAAGHDFAEPAAFFFLIGGYRQIVMVPDGMRREADRIGDDSIMIAESVIRPGIHGKPDRLHVPVLELLQRLVGREEAVKRYISLGHGTFGELSSLDQSPLLAEEGLVFCSLTVPGELRLGRLKTPSLGCRVGRKPVMDYCVRSSPCRRTATRTGSSRYIRRRSLVLSPLSCLYPHTPPA